MSAKRPPIVLCVLDGWGHRDERYGNAIANAELPVWRRMLATYPHTILAASGEEVGLPAGVMGNSEVGHINIGSGRVVPQGVVVINESLADGNFATNATLQRAIAHVRRTGGTLHLMGLLSDGRVHSSLDHLLALVDAARAGDVAKLAIHVFGDGRDVPPRSMHVYLERLERHLSATGYAGAIASVIGRFYAMDRDKRWERVERAYRALAAGEATQHAATAAAAVDAAYARGENDEFIVPTIVREARPVRSGDATIFFNFRPDRARELTLAFSSPAFDGFAAEPHDDFLFATMTRYEEDMTNPILFGPRPQLGTFGDVVAAAGLTQLRLAETEKYAHVTYFFNGGREEVFAGEDRRLVPSNRSVATYDLAPEMQAAEITTIAIEALADRAYDVIVMNYANADMVGHTGEMDATISSVETLDVSLGRLEQAVLAAGGLLAITADHGNAEEKLDPEGRPLTAHTTHPVPFVLVSHRPIGPLADGGRLGDLAPTLLALMGLPVPEQMTGRDLLAAVAELAVRTTGPAPVAG